jgi:hypothetical protein
MQSWKIFNSRRSSDNSLTNGKENSTMARKKKSEMTVTQETGVTEIQQDFLPESKAPAESKELIVVQTLGNVALPPLPVFDEHITNMLAEVKNFKCTGLEAFNRGKEWRPRATTLRDNIIQAFKPRKQTFDKAKQPTLDAENGYLNQLNTEIANITAKCTTWQREEQCKADAEKERKRQADIAEKERQRKAKADEEREAAKELEAWGDEEGAAEAQQEAKRIEDTPIIPERQTVAEVPKFAKGVRTKPKLVPHIVNPSEVARLFCVPSEMLIKAKVKTFVDYNQNPTEEQLTALAKEIGGIELKWE